MSKKALIAIVVALVVIVVIIVALMFWAGKGGLGSSNNSKTFMVQNEKVEVLRDGRGTDVVKANDYLVVNYVNKRSDGTQIDSTYDSGRNPLTFKVGANQVLKGWDVGLIGMKVGEIRRLTIPPELAFGAAGFPTAGIPKNATLTSEVELLAIQH